MGDGLKKRNGRRGRVTTRETRDIKWLDSVSHGRMNRNNNNVNVADGESPLDMVDPYE